MSLISAAAHGVATFPEDAGTVGSHIRTPYYPQCNQSFLLKQQYATLDNYPTGPSFTRTAPPSVLVALVHHSLNPQVANGDSHTLGIRLAESDETRGIHSYIINMGVEKLEVKLTEECGEDQILFGHGEAARMSVLLLLHFDVSRGDKLHSNAHSGAAAKGNEVFFETVGIV